MNLGRSVLAATATAAMLVPTMASAADVHVTIGLGHVTQGGVRKLKAAGQLHDVGGGAACTDGRHVVLQKRKSGGGWNTLDHDMTNSSGEYKIVVGDKTGKYRVSAPASGGCEKDVSDPRTHNH
jgi:hypothetical protein